ncbi:unnamed protein product [Mytilus coruscus]|uniref:Reverse transcriptase domain-containing protein n=1 Tax=Mytilus coruscus TaxID=42192 RepID=A0A6J7ZUL1_MYTCO|nr:unnamed protein product [Mytilus coruscus]
MQLKEEDPKELKQFRTVSLLNVEGKVCLAILAKRVTTHMLENNYIDTSVQKGGVPGVSGCLEHTSVLTKIIQEAKENKGDLTVLWLDLANAYGSIPHKLVDLTLKKYHIPGKVREMLQHYFNNFIMRFTVADYTTAWQRLEVGNVTGCTISVVLFSAAMNLLVKSADKMSRGPVMSSGVSQPPTRAFMDDNNSKVSSGRQVDAVRSRKERCRTERSERTGGDIIPTIMEKPVKSLGNWFRDSLNDRESVDEMVSQAGKWMDIIDKSGLPGKYKAWCYQHGILQRITWPLLMYEVPLTKVESLERMFNRHLRKWLGVPKSFSSNWFVQHQFKTSTTTVFYYRGV